MGPKCQVSGIVRVRQLTMLAFVTTEKDTWKASSYKTVNISQGLVAPVLQGFVLMNSNATCKDIGIFSIRKTTVRSREVSGPMPMIPNPSQLNRPWPQKSGESILIIHHYPTFSGGLVLQLGLARSSGPHFPAARASITRQLASSHNGQAHTLHPLPPRFLYKYLLPASHIRWLPLNTIFARMSGRQP